MVEVAFPDGTFKTVGSDNPNAAALTALATRAQNALASNQAYLAIGAPTQGQAVAQVAALTRQVDALIRLLVGRFDSLADS